MEIYDEIKRELLEGEAENVCNLIEDAIKNKYPVESILEKGLIQGIEILAEKFIVNEVLIPEVLLVSRAFNAGLDVLDDYFPKQKKFIGTALIGTVEGDIHDIGKNIIKAIVCGMGMKVYDLGVNISKEVFVQKIKEYNPDFVMISALLTTTICEMKDIIDEIKKEGLRDDVIIFVGGLPITEKYAKGIDADYFTDSAFGMKEFLSKNLKVLLNIKKSK